MVCRHCGKPVTATDTYCPHCKEDLLDNTVRKPKASTSIFTKIVIGFALLIGGVFVLGIVAAIAIPKFANTKEKAYVAAMKSDLRNMATAEEAFFADNRRYTTSLTEMNFTPSANVSAAITHASEFGWAGYVRHPATSITCRVGFGADSLRGVGDGVIHCGAPQR